MNRSLRIVAADDQPAMCRFYEDALRKLGHDVCIARTGRQLVELCQATKPDLIITDIMMPDLDGIEAADEVCRSGPVPVILVSAFQDPQLVERAAARHVLAYLAKPIEEGELAAAIALAWRRFEEFHALRKEAEELRQALEDRKVVERAKGILMKRLQTDEDGAFVRLRRLASSRKRKLVDVAREVLSAEEVFGTLDDMAAG
jgi:two-component system, response regulator PdtaR